MDFTAQVAASKAELVAKYGPAHQERIAQGIDQVAALWKPSDGDFGAFVREHFIADETLLAATLGRFEAVFEQVDGHMLEIGRELRRPSDVAVGPMLPVDPLLAQLDLSAHVQEDLFQSRLGFVVLLNFPLLPLAERLREGAGYPRTRWAESRLTQRFATRVPPEVRQEMARVAAEADLYIADYNVWMHHVLTPDGRRLFPKGQRLISHWNLRDELKARYADPEGLEKQRLIVRIMERIVTQTIPAAVVHNPRLDWTPETNQVAKAPPETVEADAPGTGTDVPSAVPEPDVRYARWLAQFHATRKADPFAPSAPTFIQRSFELGRQMPEPRVVALLEQVLSSPLVPRVAAEIQRRLGRPLEPHDLWYAGFRPQSRFDEAELDRTTRQRYPTPAAFSADLPRILQSLGFTAEKARFLAEHIVVDPARGAGHAMEAARRGDMPRLRTRIAKEGMDYKGFNIAMHELGHNVEQVFSLYAVDRTLLAGVPNNALTEAFAFVFQKRDLDALGLGGGGDSPDEALNVFWMTWEIAGVALVDVATWHWLYEHPNATPAQLKEAVLGISRDVWNRFYAPVLGSRDSVLLGIYSHLVAYPLYLADYPLGHLVAFQLEEKLAQAPALGPEVERMTAYGAVTPDLWMVHAVGAPIAAEPLLRATERALDELAKKAAP